ncbi:metallophosphoesterase family protein [Pedobacter montanisoli]|uniref:Metallophosphatase family protein n=1 Tax=Pedobacter montanisoli TaxID=2923277 RepID=A0ABS9ZZP5_9SPHI|nr:metallophosphoesterase family protein [Pedobacter montanisoli]MCJ0743790.1 metallophosphatase family protein [Pedobacter montanisoli]
MKKIGLLSDTHGFLDDAVFRHFEDCDEIWHAGDFGPDVAEPLAAFKPLRGVYGNIDTQDIRQQFPEHNRFMCEDVDVWMTHIGGYPGRYSSLVKPEIYTKPPQLFICGHSHILKVIYDDKIKCLHINPGAAGKHGWHKKRTLIRFCISEEKIHTLAVIELGNR